MLVPIPEGLIKSNKKFPYLPGILLCTLEIKVDRLLQSLFSNQFGQSDEIIDFHVPFENRFLLLDIY